MARRRDPQPGRVRAARATAARRARRHRRTGLRRPAPSRPAGRAPVPARRRGAGGAPVGRGDRGVLASARRSAPPSTSTGCCRSHSVRAAPGRLTVFAVPRYGTDYDTRGHDGRRPTIAVPGGPACPSRTPRRRAPTAPRPTSSCSPLRAMSASRYDALVFSAPAEASPRSCRPTGRLCGRCPSGPRRRRCRRGRGLLWLANSSTGGHVRYRSGRGFDGQYSRRLPLATARVQPVRHLCARLVGYNHTAAFSTPLPADAGLDLERAAQPRVCLRRMHASQLCALAGSPNRRRWFPPRGRGAAFLPPPGPSRLPRCRARRRGFLISDPRPNLAKRPFVPSLPGGPSVQRALLASPALVSRRALRQARARCVLFSGHLPRWCSPAMRSPRRGARPRLEAADAKPVAEILRTSRPSVDADGRDVRPERRPAVE